jgi:hypothetical protein
MVVLTVFLPLRLFVSPVAFRHRNKVLPKAPLWQPEDVFCRFSLFDKQGDQMSM